jgi:hypothetical protein
MNLDGHNLEDLPGTFDCDVFVPGASMTAMREAGVPMDGFIDNAEGNGRAKWEKVGPRRVLFRGSGHHADRFLSVGWSVEAVPGRPLMPDTKGKGRRRDHVASFEVVWLLATPPAKEETS